MGDPLMSDGLVPVTIGIPFYNCGPYLLEAIRSVFAQTHKNWELILIDDGSSDDSVAVALSIKDPRVRVFSDGRNLGLAARLNQIVDLARYDLVARMDGDDLMHPRRLERQLSLLASNPQADLIGTGTYSVTANGVLVGLRTAEKTNPSLEDVIIGSHGLIHASVVYKREWALRNRYDPKVQRSEDMELWARAAARGDLRAITIAEPLYIYREDLNVTRDKLLAAYAAERTCVVRHVRKSYFLLKCLGRNVAKTILVSLFFGRRLQRWLHERRNPKPPTPEMVKKLAETLEAIRKTHIPIDSYS